MIAENHENERLTRKDERISNDKFLSTLMLASQKLPEKQIRVKYIPNQLLDSTGHLLSEHKRPLQQQPLIKQRPILD